MVNLGVATDLTAEDSATAIAKMANITGMATDEYAKFGASLTALGNNFATQESEILNMATRLSSTGDLVGLNEYQILALSTALSSMGAEAESGGTAMSKMFRKMQLSIETGDKNLAKFAKVSGMSVKEFKKLFEKDALSALNTFAKGLGNIEASGGSAIATLDDMGLSEVRLSDNLLKLVTSGDMLDRTLQTAKKGWEEAGTSEDALAKEANKRYAETKYQLGQLRETLGEVAVDLGETLLPVINKIVDGIKSLTDKFTQLSPTARTIILVILGIVAVLAPLLIGIGKLITTIGMVMVFLPMITTALSAPLIPIMLIVTAIGALITIIGLAYAKCDWFREGVNTFFSSIWETIQLFIGLIVQIIQVNIQTISLIIQMIANLIMTIVQGCTDTIMSIITFGADFIMGIVDMLTGVFQGLLDFLLGVFTGDWERAWNGIAEIFGAIGEGIKETFKAVINFLIDQINNFIQGVNNIQIPEEVPRNWWISLEYSINT